MLVFGAPQVELGGGITTYQPSSEPPIATTTYFLKGSTSGDYSTTNNSSFANVDGTNLSKAVFVPAGWNLAIDAMGWVYAPTAGNGTNIALADGGTLINAVSATSGRRGRRRAVQLLAHDYRRQRDAHDFAAVAGDRRRALFLEDGQRRPGLSGAAPAPGALELKKHDLAAIL